MGRLPGSKNKKPKVAIGGSWRLTCFTEYDMERDMEELASNFQYLAYSQEVCPTTGRPHFQCFAYSAKKIPFGVWKKHLGVSHFEKCAGSLEDNEKYCSKESDGKLIKYGIRPMASGHKVGLTAFCEALRDGRDLEEVTREDPVTRCMYANGLKAVAQAYFNKRIADARPKGVAPEVIYVWGPSRTGKSEWCRDQQDITYACPMTDKFKWKDGYKGEEAVLYDNVDLNNFIPSALLVEIDKYPIQVPYKGGFYEWRPKKIYITSVHSPRTLAERGGFDQPAELLGRITRVVKYAEYFDPSRAFKMTLDFD